MGIEVTKLPPQSTQDKDVHLYRCTAEDNTSADVYTDHAGAVVDIPAVTGPLANDSASIELECNFDALESATREAIVTVIAEAALKIAAINRGLGE